MAKSSSFSKKEILSQAFESTKKNFLFLLGVLVIFFVYSVVRGLVSAATKEFFLVAFLISILFLLGQMVLQLGMVKVSLDLVDRGKAEFSELYMSYPKLLNFLVASIVYGFVVVLGLILFVIPGIYLIIRYQFYTYYILDKNASAIDSLHMSADMTRGNILNLFLLSIIIVFINILGAILLFVGLLFTIPMSMMVYAYLYRKLA